MAQAYRTLNRLLAAAVDDELIGRNPLKGVKPPQVQGEPMRFVTHEEVATLASVIDDRYRTLVFVAAAADVKVLQRMLGHASAALTLDRYGHLMPGQAESVAERLDQMARAAKPTLSAEVRAIEDRRKSAWSEAQEALELHLPVTVVDQKPHRPTGSGDDGDAEQGVRPRHRVVAARPRRIEEVGEPLVHQRVAVWVGLGFVPPLEQLDADQTEAHPSRRDRISAARRRRSSALSPASCVAVGVHSSLGRVCASRRARSFCRRERAPSSTRRSARSMARADPASS